MFLTRLPLRIATAFDLHVLGLPPAFVLSQDQTLKLYEKIVPTSHCHKTSISSHYSLKTDFFDESQAHPFNHASQHKNAMNLRYV